MLFSCTREGPQPREATIERDRWPFREFEMREARSFDFENSTPEQDQYGPVWVSNVPFLGTSDVDRLECRESNTWVHLNDRGARALREMTERLVRERGRLAIYADQKLVTAPLVQGELVEGQFQLLKYPCARK